MTSASELQQKIANSYLRVQKRFDPRVAFQEGLKGALVGAVMALIAKEVVKTPLVNSSPRFTLCTMTPALVWGMRGCLKSHEWAHQELNQAFLCAEASKERKAVYQGLTESLVKAKDSFLDGLSDLLFEKCCEDPDELRVKVVQMGLGSDSLFRKCLKEGLIKDSELSRRLFTRWAHRQLDKKYYNEPVSQEKMSELLQEVDLSIPPEVRLRDDQRSIMIVALLLELATPTGLDSEKVDKLNEKIRAPFSSRVSSVRSLLI